MLDRIPGELEGLDSEAKRVKLEEQVTTVAIPQPKVNQSENFELFPILQAWFIRDFFSHHEGFMTTRHVLTTQGTADPHNTAPSRVVHARAVPDGCTHQQMVASLSKFGKIRCDG